MQTEAKTLIAIGVGVVVIGTGLLLWHSQNKTLSQSQPVDGSKLIRSDSQVIGKSDAPNTIVEFGDYQCPACGAAHPILKQLMQEQPDKFKIVFRNFPLPQHKNAYPGSQAAEAAGKQGKYTEMHDMLYEHQNEWAELPDPQSKFEEFAKSLNLDMGKFTSDYTDSILRERIKIDVDDGTSLGVNSTPTFYLNGEKLEGWKFNTLKDEIVKRLK